MRRVWWVCLLWGLILPAGATGSGAVGGTYAGLLGSLHLRLHVVAAADGTLAAVLDSPDQGAHGIVCSEVIVNGGTLSFSVPGVGGAWKGSIENDGARLVGTWTQGSPRSLTLEREQFVAADAPSPVDGTWLGSLQAGARPLRIQIIVKSNRAGDEFCTLDSIDQGAFNLECANAAYRNRQLSFDVPAVHGHWSGDLTRDGRSLRGVWTQGVPIALEFTRQARPWSRPPTTYDPAMAPVDAAHLQAVLDRDLAAVRKSGALAPGTAAGITVGVMQAGVRRIFTYGAARPDSLYEIGSLSKTFTGLILAQMIEQGVVQPDEPVRALLPEGVVPRPAGAEITLLDLVTQHSGLPRLPGNLHPVDRENPYADYHPSDLYQFLAAQGVAKSGTPAFLYSNLGVGLLGDALASRAHRPYPVLLLEQVTGPLRLSDTVITPSADQQRRFIQGHGADHSPARTWDFDALAGAGAIRSTASDMLAYLGAQLHPDAAAAGLAAAGAGSRTLAAAIKRSQKLEAEGPDDLRIAFAWLFDPKSGSYQHGGVTGGYSCAAFFNPEADIAGVVLTNTAAGRTGSFADALAQHVAQRLGGAAARSLSEGF